MNVAEIGIGDRLWCPAFPSPGQVLKAAASLPTMREAAGPGSVQLEGPRWEVVIAPGAIQVRTVDWTRASRYREREVQREQKRVDQLAAWLAGDGKFPAGTNATRQIIGWSRVSRANMVRSLCQLDYSPLFSDLNRIPAMLTLTYPGDWVTVAPSGKAVKDHLKALRKRYIRAWGEDLACVWKLEFQRRGAPHVHLLMLPPCGVSADGRPFRQWVSESWAAVVNHPDARRRPLR